MPIASTSFLNLRHFISSVSIPSQIEGPTRNALPGSPEVISEDIRSAEEDIACWQRGIADARLQIASLTAEIDESEIDIAFARGKLVKLRAKLALVDRRIAQKVLTDFRDRRRAVASVSGLGGAQ